VGIHVQRQRYRCKACGRTFYEPLPEMHPDHLMTRRLVTYIEQQALPKTFVELADEIGVDEKTIRLVFKSYVQRLEQETTFWTPVVLGIDEVHLVSQPRCILSNVEQHTIVDLLKNRTRATVTNRLRQFPNRERIEVVVMDMWRPYFDAVQEVLPGATVVIDKFHVVRMVNDALETVRKALRAELSARQRRGLLHDRFILLRRGHDLTDQQRLVLESWTGTYPQLKQAYELKEAFFTIWDTAQMPDEAQERYAAWQRTIPAALIDPFKAVTTAITNWNEPVFNYFIYRNLTNTYTESLNGLVKEAARRGRGYSFDVIRAKALFSNGFHRSWRPPYDRNKQADKHTSTFVMGRFTLTDQSPPGTHERPPLVNVGATFQSVGTFFRDTLVNGKSTKNSG
jgi:transposase